MKINIIFNISSDLMGLSNQSHIVVANSTIHLFSGFPAALPLSLILDAWATLPNKVLAHKPFLQALLPGKLRQRQDLSVSLFWLFAISSEHVLCTSAKVI